MKYLFNIICFFPLLNIQILNAQAAPPKPYGPVPSKYQMEWQQLEYYMFVHFGPNTFTDVEWGNGKEDPKVFNPIDLDCRQWAATAKAAGMKGIIITAKHHDGFCLWPSRYSTHTVRESPWKNGRGDVLEELSLACREYGLKFGVYLSPWDRNHPAYGTPDYNQVFSNTLNEVLTNYGEVFEQWFDGANGEGHGGKKQVYDWDMFHKTVYRNQPQAIIFSDVGPGCRWMGNEKGVAGETNWSRLNIEGFEPGKGAPAPAILNSGEQNGKAWIPAEVDVSIRPGWFYSPATNDKVKPVDKLMDIYYTSVGRNSNLLLNVPPDRRGRIHPNDSTRLMEFRKAREETFRENLIAKAAIKASNTRGNSSKYAAGNMQDKNYNTYWATNDNELSPCIEIDLKKDKTFNCLLLQEYVPLGQRVSSFCVKYWDSKEKNWKELIQATTIGYKRILRFPAVTAQKLRIELNALACPTISAIGIFNVPGQVPVPLADKNKTANKIPAQWKILSPNTTGIESVIDGNPESFATINKNEALVIDLGKTSILTGFTYTPPATVQSPDIIYKYDFYISSDGEKWTQVKNSGTFDNIANSPVEQKVLLDKAVLARYIRLKPLETVGNKDVYTVSEIGIITESVRSPDDDHKSIEY